MAINMLRDTFTITDVDAVGKKFDRVSRITAKSDQFEADMELDVNTEIYPMRKGERFTMELASTLNLDGTPDSGYFTQVGRRTLADDFEYVMQGKLYKIDEHKRTGKAVMLASFGGLLMQLKVDIAVSDKCGLDQRLFLLMKKFREKGVHQ